MFVHAVCSGEFFTNVFESESTSCTYCVYTPRRIDPQVARAEGLALGIRLDGRVALIALSAEVSNGTLGIAGVAREEAGRAGGVVFGVALVLGALDFPLLESPENKMDSA